MQAIIRRFDRAPLEGRLLRANQAQPPKAKGPPKADERSSPNLKKQKRAKGGSQSPKSAFATELAKAL